MRLNHVFLFILSLLCFMPPALTQLHMKHVRIVDGVESVVNQQILKPSSASNTSSAGRQSLTERWDGSPAYVEWQPACNRGCTLDGMLNSDDATAGRLLVPPRARAHSDFLDVNDLKRWGYITKTLRKDPKCEMGNAKDAYGLERYLKTNGFSVDKKDWNCVRITHGDPDRGLDDQTYTDPRDANRKLRVTGARFHLAMNPKDGIIVIAKQYSPAAMNQYIRPPVPVEEFPALRSTSDIMWLAWKKYHDQGARLQLIITWTAINRVTQRVLATALDPDFKIPDSQKKLQPYPWAGWKGDSMEGKAILGTPNGAGVAYFLAQHKPELGNKRIKRIEAFAADTQASGVREPSIAWELEDVP